MRRHGFRSMGTDVSLIAPDPVDGFDRAAGQVEVVFAAIDERFSRFRPDSELSGVNANAGRWTPISATFAQLLSMALSGAERTAGLFDPTVLPALIAAGYDRDFEVVRARRASPSAPPPGPGGRWGDVELDCRGKRLRMPPEVALDFGGIAKGWAVDLAVENLGWPPWAVVDAGGDIRIGGHPPDGGVDIAVEDPERSETEVLRLRLSSGALATSSVVLRSWGAGWRAGVHHIIDPRTGRPALTSVIQATTWADTCAEAEVRSTWALLGGPATLAEVPGVLFLDNGEVRLNLEPLEPPRPGEEGGPATSSPPGVDRSLIGG
jgi:thiamine biosynthesis lipoprotein